MEETTLGTAETTYQAPKAPPHRDAFGTLFGLLVFCGGVGLLLVTFRLAYNLFTVPPESPLGIQQGKVLDLAKAGDSAAVLILRILLLLIMAFVGSLVANRGISLYADARAHRK
ncbi:MAG: hypothetical protein ACYC96_01575 [Fimbriimonadaceae bacterium]